MEATEVPPPLERPPAAGVISLALEAAAAQRSHAAGSMTAWRFVAQYALPVPLVLLVVLNLPLPRPMKRGVLLFVHRVFDLPVLGFFRLLHVMLMLMGAAFAGTLRSLAALAEQHAAAAASPHGPAAEVALLSRRWRAERNLWISGFAFTAWALLAAFYREAARRAALEERLRDIEEYDYTATATATKDTSAQLGGPGGAGGAGDAGGPSREVTSRPRETPRGAPSPRPPLGGTPRGGGPGALPPPPGRRPAAAAPAGAKKDA